MRLTPLSWIVVCCSAATALAASPSAEARRVTYNDAVRFAQTRQVERVHLEPTGVVGRLRDGTPFVMECANPVVKHNVYEMITVIGYGVVTADPDVPEPPASGRSRWTPAVFAALLYGGAAVLLVLLGLRTRRRAAPPEEAVEADVVRARGPFVPIVLGGLVVFAAMALVAGIMLEVGPLGATRIEPDKLTGYASDRAVRSATFDPTGAEGVLVDGRRFTSPIADDAEQANAAATMSTSGGTADFRLTPAHSPLTIATLYAPGFLCFVLCAALLWLRFSAGRSGER